MADILTTIRGRDTTVTYVSSELNALYDARDQAIAAAETAEAALGAGLGEYGYSHVFTAVGNTFTIPITEYDEVVQSLFIDGARQLESTWEQVSGVVTLSVAQSVGTVVTAVLSRRVPEASVAPENISGSTVTGRRILTGVYGAVIPFPTRAEAVTWWASHTPPVGTQMIAGGYRYEYTGSGTVIADLPGWVPLGEPYLDHWKENAAPGTTDMTSAMQAAWDAGYIARVKGANAISGRVSKTGGTVGLIGENPRTDYIIALASGYNETTASATAAANTTFFELTNGIAPKFRGVGFRWHATTGRFLHSCIRLITCQSPDVRELRFSDFPTGKMIMSAGCTGFPVARDLAAVDCVNSVVISGATSTRYQCTVIEVDNEGAAGAAWNISGIRGNNMGQRGAALAVAGNYQSDVVNIHKGKGHIVTDVSGIDVGEVVDIFTHECTGGNFYGLRCDGSTIKLIHGASRNSFHGVVAIDTGRQGVSFTDGNGGYYGTPTEDNVVTGIVVKNVDPDNIYGASYGTACIRFDYSGTGFGTRNNRAEAVYLSPGTYGKYTVIAEYGVEKCLLKAQKWTAGVSGEVNMLVPTMLLWARTYTHTVSGNNWTVEINEDGTAECWLTLADPTAWATADGALYRRASSLTVTHPPIFAAAPTLTLTAYAGVDNAIGARARVAPDNVEFKATCWSSVSLSSANGQGVMFRGKGKVW